MRYSWQVLAGMWLAAIVTACANAPGVHDPTGPALLAERQNNHLCTGESDDPEPGGCLMNADNFLCPGFFAGMPDVCRLRAATPEERTRIEDAIGHVMDPAARMLLLFLLNRGSISMYDIFDGEDGDAHWTIGQPFADGNQVHLYSPHVLHDGQAELVDTLCHEAGHILYNFSHGPEMDNWIQDCKAQH